MAVTASGTVYTVHNITLGGDNPTYWAVADAHAADADIPTLIYTHGNSGSASQFTSFSAWSGLRDWWIDNGGAYVEGLGGGSTFGNQAARDAYEESFAYVQTQIDVGRVAVLGRSMGGIVGYWLASQSPLVAPLCDALIINSGTTDLTVRSGGYPGAAEFQNWFGINPDGSNFESVMDEFDPMRQPLSDWTGRNVMQLWGSADTTVDPDVHGKAWIAKYGGSVALLATDERAGGDHTQTNGSYLQTAPMTAFLAEAMSIGDVAPPDEPSMYRILGHWLYQDGERYVMQPVV